MCGALQRLAAREMSRSLARASEHTVTSRMAVGDRLHGLEITVARGGEAGFDDVHAQPLSWRAMRSFSSRVIEAPGDCSPSRKVVSKMMSLRSWCGLGRWVAGSQAA